MPRKPSMDWLRMERELRATLREYTRGDLLALEALRRIDAIVAARTDRGNELPLGLLDWEARNDLPAEAWMETTWKD